MFPRWPNIIKKPLTAPEAILVDGSVAAVVALFIITACFLKAQTRSGAARECTIHLQALHVWEPKQILQNSPKTGSHFQTSRFLNLMKKFNRFEMHEIALRTEVIYVCSHLDV